MSSDDIASVEEADVVIVGARLAGAATAVPLARAGLRVVVLDKVRFPSDTLSTHAMTPSAVQELVLMGALDRVLGLRPAKPRYLTIYDGDISFRERFHPFLGIDFALCIPRDQLDALLVETARDAGADVRERCGVEDVVWAGARCAGVRYRSGGRVHEIRARVVVGADGRKSRTAAALGVWQPYRGSANLRGFAFRYLDDPIGAENQDAYEIFRAHGNITLMLPSCPAGRAVAVHMCDVRDIPWFRSDPEAAWAAKLAADPNWRARIDGTTNMGRIRITDDLASFYRRSSGPGWALAGDAGHFKDPVVGQGHRDALRHGRLLGYAITANIGDPAALDEALLCWERARDRDTISTYHWGNRETRPNPTSALVRAVLSGFAENDTERPCFSDTFNRVRPVENVINPVRLVRGLVRALREPGADRRAIFAEVRREIPNEIGLRRHRLIDAFRSARPVTTEHPGWSVDKPPAHRSDRSGATAGQSGSADGKHTADTVSA
jgi:2-polyprenyl-6-methoxyphenol hydroxylase-like FAD-dependent oxidoreductase